MRVFCSQCGTPNDGEPGTKVICTNCTSVFEVPAPFGTAQTVMSAPPPPAASNPQPTAPPPSASPEPVVPQVLPPAPNWGAPTVNPGQPGPIYPAPPSGPQTSSLAIASLVLGILGLMPCLCIPFPIASAIFGFIAINRINANPQGETGKGLATAGIVISGLSVLLWGGVMLLGMLADKH